MRLRFTAVSLAVVAGVLVLVAGATGAMVGIYRNSMETTSQRSQLVKLSGRSCARGGSSHTLRIVIGKRTGECSYRTPVVGRDLEVAATERLLSGTPKGAAAQGLLGLVLRAGGGAQLPACRLSRSSSKVQLVRYLGEGSVKYLAIEKEVGAVKGVDKANQLRLPPSTSPAGPKRASASCAPTSAASSSPKPPTPAPANSPVAPPACRSARRRTHPGSIASIDDVVVRVPSPF